MSWFRELSPPREPAVRLARVLGVASAGAAHLRFELEVDLVVERPAEVALAVSRRLRRNPGCVE